LSIGFLKKVGRNQAYFLRKNKEKFSAF
jgi:hypothetical protein